MPEDQLNLVRDFKSTPMSDLKEGLTKEYTEAFSHETKHDIDYIITLGGDGTILYAANHFNTGSIPPMITFAQGSLGFMCNFTFEDHEAVLRPILLSAINGMVADEVGLESRLRLKVNMGPGCSANKQVFRGD